MASNFLKTLVLAAAACSGLLTGCGDEPATGVQTSTPSSYSSYPSGAAAYPSGTTTGTATAGNIYGTPTSACGQTATGTTQGALPGVVATQPAAGTQVGCGQTGQPGVAAPPAASAKSGMEATIAERKESGIFSKSLKSVTVTVTNNEATSQTKFLLVAFTKKDAEVEVQYKSLVMSPGGSATFLFSATKDADDATVELRDSLL